MKRSWRKATALTALVGVAAFAQDEIGGERAVGRGDPAGLIESAPAGRDPASPDPKLGPGDLDDPNVGDEQVEGTGGGVSDDFGLEPSLGLDDALGPGDGIGAGDELGPPEEPGTGGAGEAARGSAGSPLDVEGLQHGIEGRIGERLFVMGQVEQQLVPGAFILEGGGYFGDEIAVIVPKELRRAQGRLVEEGAELLVRGTVRALPMAAVEREIGWDLDPKLESELDASRYFLVADQLVARAGGPGRR